MDRDNNYAFQYWDGTKRKKTKAIFYIVGACMAAALYYQDPYSLPIFLTGAYLYLR